MTDRYERIREEMSMTAETSNARGEVEYEYEVWQGDALQAGGRENDYASAKSEANHYAMMYAQDGPVEVRIYEKRLLSADKVERDWLAPALDAPEVGSEDGRQAEIEKLRAEVERLNRILGRIVEGDGDSTVTIRAGADAFAAAREYLRED